MKNLSFPGLPRVLIVDDEEGVREGLRSLLQREGLHVETAGTAEEGVRRIEQRSFDVVFLDLNLPGADGLSMLGRFRRGSPPADILVLTGHGTVANTVEAMRKGAADVIEKPFASDRILAIVRRVLETRQLKNELAWLHDRVRELTATELVGHLEQAIDHLKTYLALCDELGEHVFEAELWRRRALFEMRLPAPDASVARAALAKARELAREEGMYRFEAAAIRDEQRLFGDSAPLAERLTTIQETFPDLAPRATSRA